MKDLETELRAATEAHDKESTERQLGAILRVLHAIFHVLDSRGRGIKLIGVAFVIVILCSVAGLAWVGFVADNASTTAEQVAKLQEAFLQQRVTLTRDTCERRRKQDAKSNNQTKQGNALVEEQARQVIVSTQSARALGPALQRLGFPPYRELLRLAQQRAAKLRRLKIRGLLVLENCDRLVARVAGLAVPQVPPYPHFTGQQQGR